MRAVVLIGDLFGFYPPAVTARLEIVLHGDGDGVRQRRQPAAPCFVVGVKDHFADLMVGKQQLFSRFVALHIAVIIEMIAAQIGKDRGGERQRRNAMLHQTVR